MTRLFQGQITDGKLLLDNKADFTGHLQSLDGKRVEVTVEKYRRKRTVDQNSYFHGVVIPLIAKETGEDPETVKAFLKEKFAAKLPAFKTWIPKPTHLMDTVEMTELVERSRVWASEFLNTTIPDPQQVE